MSYVFQAIDWWAKDINIYNDDEADNDLDNGYIDFDNMPFNLKKRKYIIKIFGRREDGSSISVSVIDFKPFFYVKLEDVDIINDREKRKYANIHTSKGLVKEKISKIIEKFKNFIEFQEEKNDIDKNNLLIETDDEKKMIGIDYIISKDMWGFNGRKDEIFVKITCNNFIAMKMVEKKIRLNSYKFGIYDIKRKLQIYESNIEPMLRFIHLQNLNTTGWITIDKKKAFDKDACLKYDKVSTSCERDICVSWKDVLPYNNSQIAPFKILSWDIECTSSHGDFPVAIKNYMKVARDLIAFNNKLLRENVSNQREQIITQIHNAFVNGYHKKNLDCEIGAIYPKECDKASELLKLDDDNTAQTLIKLLEQHSLDIFAILEGKVIFEQLLSIEKQKQIALYKAKNANNDDYDHGVQEQQEDNLNANSDDEDEEYSTKRDERVEQLIHKFNKIFPNLEGDPIIQIGMVIEKFGDLNYEKVILNLKGCDDIEGAKVYAFDKEDMLENEKKLIKKFVHIVNKSDVDIVTGFNIFGFDYQYLYDRAKELKCTEYLEKMSKFNHIKSSYQVKQLSSSALGHNELKYIESYGRVLIDIMKIVQRDYKLDYYNLDFISSTFMNGKIKNVLEVDEIFETDGVQIKLQLDNILGINKGNYIKINDIKYKVVDLDIDKAQIAIIYTPEGETTDDIHNKFEGKKWGLAKDDVTPKEIFECYRGTDTQRALVAHYCLQDSALCNNLMNKLKLIPQNFGMASVCNVPLSYIIMRGQGIKVFSLISKVCHYQGYRIPVIKKVDEEDSYEGAIVLVPEPGIYVDEPVAVNDYASLYPSSMISENISHDSLVLDEEKYGNLPNTNYVEIEYDIYKFEIKGKQKFKVNTGKKQICRYAQFVDENGKRDVGIIPKTLQKLLSARKNTRKQILEKTFVMNDKTEYKGIIANETDTTITIKLLDDGILDSGERYSKKMELDKSNIDSQNDSYNDFEKAVLDGLQLAYKVTANSVYGQVGARTSNIYLKELAASTTATGRNLILEAKKYAEEKYDAHIVYGDSVPFDEPIVIKYPDERIDVRAISDIVQEEEWKEFTEYKDKNFVNTIRGMLVSIILDGVSNKEQFDEFTEIIPKWIRKQAIENRIAIKNISNKWFWELNPNETDEEKLNHINKLCDMFIESTKDRTDKFQSNPEIQVWTDNGWQKVFRLIKHKTNKKMYRVSTGNGVVDVTEDHSLCDKDLKPIKPNEIEIGKTELLHHQIDTTLFKEIIPIVPEYPSEFYGEDIQDKQKFVDTSGELYTCSKCKNEYDRSMYYWNKHPKVKTGEKRRTAQCKLCVKKKQCQTKGKEFNGQLDNVRLDIVKPSYTLTKEEAWVWGFYMGDGSSDRYEFKSNTRKKGTDIKYSWAINNQDLDRLNHAKELLEQIEPEEMRFKILDTMESSGVYKLVPTGSLRYMAVKYRVFMYDKFRQKKVPQIILQAPYEIRKAFFDGYYEADGTKTKELGYSRDENWINSYSKVNFTTKGKSTAQGLYLLALSLGYTKLSIHRWSDKDRVYTISSYNVEQNINRKVIKYMEEIPMTILERDYEKYNIKFTDEFVYDIETTTGRFNSGVGGITLQQTDSLFLKYPKHLSSNMSEKERLELSFHTAQEFGENFRTDILKTCKYRKLNSYIPPEGYQDTPHDFEYEKTFYPFIIFSKKRYVGHLFETNPDKFVVKSMGIALKRRDNAKIVKHIYGGIIDIILKEKDVNKSLDFLNEELTKLIENKFSLEMLTITKVLNATYAAPEKIPQKALADRMRARDPGSAPQVNDRVPYAFIKLDNEEKGTIQADRVEHPKYIQENNLQLDYRYYIENQIMKPILQLYTLNITKLKEFPHYQNYFKDRYDKLYDEYIVSEYRGVPRTKEDAERLAHQTVEREKHTLVQHILFDKIISKYDTTYISKTDKENEKKAKLEARALAKEKAKSKSRAKLKEALSVVTTVKPVNLDGLYNDDTNEIIDNNISISYSGTPLPSIDQKNSIQVGKDGIVIVSSQKEDIKPKAKSKSKAKPKAKKSLQDTINEELMKKK